MSFADCVTSLQGSMQRLESSLHLLDEGVNDLPRLSKALQSTRHFELTSESDIQQAQQDVLSEIRPEVESLLNRVQNYLDKLERREQSLIAKSDLNDGRLGSYGGATEESGSTPRKSVGGSGNVRGMSALQEMKFKQLKAKKQRLSYSVETLELQARQRQRQLRMSMAAPQLGYGEED